MRENKSTVFLQKLGYCLIILIAGSQVSAELLRQGYFYSDHGYEAFKLINGTLVTPSSLVHLYEFLPSIESILSVGFLLWLEMEDSDRYSILELLKDMNVEGTSQHLVNKLIRHHQSQNKTKTVDRLLRHIESGQFVETLTKKMDTVHLSMSKSMIRASLLKYGEPLFKIGNTNGSCEYSDILDGIAGRHELSWITAETLLLSGECAERSTAILGTRILDWEGWENISTNIADILATLESLIGLFNLPAWGEALPFIGIVLTIYVMVFDFKALINGNLSNIETAIHVISITAGLVGLGLAVWGILIAFALVPGVGWIVSLAGVILGLVVFFINLSLEIVNRNKNAKPHVLKLDMAVPLTEEEKRREEQNYRDGRPIDPALKQLMDKTAYNAALVGTQLENMADMPDVEKFIFPAVESNAMVIVNSIADLRVKKTVNLQRWAPRTALVDKIPGSSKSRVRNHIICAPEATDSNPTGQMEAYPCEDSIGVFEDMGRTNNLTMFMLGNGTDSAYGTLEFTNIFLVEKGNKRFFGGDTDDVFLVKSADLVGLFDGGSGNNILDINAENVTSEVEVTIDLANSVLQLNSKTVTLANMTIINGREGLGDRIIGNCQAFVINGRGGGTSVKDQIEIPRSVHCSYSLSIEVNMNTIILNEGFLGQFIYNISTENFETNARLEISQNVNSTHLITLEPGLERLLNVTYLDQEFLLQSDNSQHVFTSTIVLLNETNQYHEPTVIIHPGNITIKVDNKKIVNTIFNLTVPNDLVKAPRFGQSVFLLQTQVDHIVGEAGNDTVFLMKNASSQRISGGLGVNTLILDSEFWPASNVKVNMVDETLGFMDNDGLDRKMLVQGFEQVLGRKGLREDFTIGCSSAFVDGQGGEEGNTDQIDIVTAKCERLSYIRLGSHTVLQNRALEGSFLYFIGFNEDVEINIDFRKGLNHTFQFDFDLNEVTNMSVASSVGGRNQNKLVLVSRDAMILELPVSNITSEAGYFEAPTFLTRDIVVLQAGIGKVMAVHNVSMSPVDEIQGADFAENMFIISDGLRGTITGGEKSDTFIIYNGASNISSNLRGGGGSDRVVLDNDYISFDFFDMADYDSIEEFVGRNSTSDRIRISCSTKIVDGMDGKGSMEPDIYEIPTDDCSYNTLFLIRDFTKIENNGASNGDFKYMIQSKGGHTSLNYESGNHTIILPHKQHEIQNVEFFNSSRIMYFHTFNSTYSWDILLNASSLEHLQPTVVITDGIRFNVKNASVSNNVTATFVLGSDRNSTKGFNNLENIFLLQEGVQIIAGGGLDDVFIVANASLQLARMDGAGGTNTLLISDEIPENHQVIVTTSDETLNEEATVVIFGNMSNILGRNGSVDQITIDCDVKIVDGKGGARGCPDIIVIPDLPCNFSTTIVIHESTTVRSSAKQGNFMYSLLDREADFFIDCNDCTNATHTFAVSFEAEVVQNLTVSDCTVNLLNADNEIFFRYGLRNVNETALCKYPQLVSSDSFIIDVSFVGAVHGQFVTNGTSAPDLIDMYITRSSALNASMTILTEEEEYVLIGREGFDMLHSSPNHRSHIHGNGGPNLYVIAKQNSSIADVFIYCPPLESEKSNSSMDIIDITQLIHPIRTRENDYYLPNLDIEDETGNLVLTVNDGGIQSARITFLDWEWLVERGAFLLGESFMKIVMTEGLIKFQPLPNNFTNETTILLDLLEFEEGAEISLPERTLPPDNAILRQGDDLILTNYFDLDSEDESFYVSFKNFMDVEKRGARNLPRNVELKFSNINFNMDTITSDYEIQDIEIVKETIAKEIEEEVFAFNCLGEGLYPNPKDCSGYYRCVKIGTELIALPLPCPTGSIFCGETLICDSESETCPCKQVNRHLFTQRVEL